MGLYLHFKGHVASGEWSIYVLLEHLTTRNRRRLKIDARGLPEREARCLILRYEHSRVVCVRKQVDSCGKCGYSEMGSDGEIMFDAADITLQLLDVSRSAIKR